MTYFIKFPIAMVLTGLLACSVVDGGGNGGDPNGGAGEASFSTQLTGNWTGHMVNKTVDAGSALRESAVVAEFSFTSETEGNFKFSVPKVDNAQAEGTFSDFAGKSLHLNLVKSTISTLGMTGSATSITYNMIGSDLELTNDRVSLQMIKSASAKPDAGDGTKPTATEEDIAIGRWVCADRYGNSWKFNIKSKTALSLDVFSGSGNAPAIWLDGSLALTVAANKKMSGTSLIVSSSNKDYVGMRLSLQFIDASAMNVDQMKSKDETDSVIEDSFQCNKI